MSIIAAALFAATAVQARNVIFSDDFEELPLSKWIALSEKPVQTGVGSSTF